MADAPDSDSGRLSGMRVQNLRSASVRAERASPGCPAPRHVDVREVFHMPAIDMVGTGQNIQRIRKMAGLTIKDIQQACGCATPNAVYKWIHGVCMPTIDNLVILAAVLGVKVDDIIVVRII